MDAIDGELASQPTANAAQRTAIWQAIGRAIVTHIQGATVTIAPGAVATGVTAGPAAVPVTGTAVIT